MNDIIITHKLTYAVKILPRKNNIPWIWWYKIKFTLIWCLSLSFLFFISLYILVDALFEKFSHQNYLMVNLLTLNYAIFFSTLATGIFLVNNEKLWYWQQIQQHNSASKFNNYKEWIMFLEISPKNCSQRIDFFTELWTIY